MGRQYKWARREYLRSTVLDFQANRAKNQWVLFYSERSAWSTRDQAGFHEGLVRAGPQAITDYERMLKASEASRNAPSVDIGPRVPGNFYKTEEESGKK